MAIVTEGSIWRQPPPRIPASPEMQQSAEEMSQARLELEQKEARLKEIESQIKSAYEKQTDPELAARRQYISPDYYEKKQAEYQETYQDYLRAKTEYEAVGGKVQEAYRSRVGEVYERTLLQAGATPEEARSGSTNIQSLLGAFERGEITESEFEAKMAEYNRQWEDVLAARQQQAALVKYQEPIWARYYKTTGDPIGAGFISFFEPAGKFLAESVSGRQITTRPADVIFSPSSEILFYGGQLGAIALTGYAAGGATRGVIGVVSKTGAGAKMAAAAASHPTLIKTASITAVAGIETYKYGKMIGEGYSVEEIFKEAGRDVAFFAGFYAGVKGPSDKQMAVGETEKVQSKMEVKWMQGKPVQVQQEMWKIKPGAERVLVSKEVARQIKQYPQAILEISKRYPITEPKWITGGGTEVGTKIAGEQEYYYLLARFSEGTTPKIGVTWQKLIKTSPGGAKIVSAPTAGTYSVNLTQLGNIVKATRVQTFLVPPEWIEMTKEFAVYGKTIIPGTQPVWKIQIPISVKPLSDVARVPTVTIRAFETSKVGATVIKTTITPLAISGGYSGAVVKTGVPLTFTPPTPTLFTVPSVGVAPFLPVAAFSRLPIVQERPREAEKQIYLPRIDIHVKEISLPKIEQMLKISAKIMETEMEETGVLFKTAPMQAQSIAVGQALLQLQVQVQTQKQTQATVIKIAQPRTAAALTTAPKPFMPHVGFRLKRRAARKPGLIYVARPRGDPMKRFFGIRGWPRTWTGAVYQTERRRKKWSLKTSRLV